MKFRSHLASSPSDDAPSLRVASRMIYGEHTPKFQSFLTSIVIKRRRCTASSVAHVEVALDSFGAGPEVLKADVREDTIPADMTVLKCVSAEAAWYVGHLFLGYLRGNCLLGNAGALRGDWARGGDNQREAPFPLQQYFPLANNVSGHCPCASCCELAGAVCHRSRGESGGPARADVARTRSLA